MSKPPDQRCRTVRPPLTVVGLFAGIGGLELGLTRAGHKAGVMSEIDEGAQAVLRARFKGVPVHGNISKIKQLPRGTGLVAAGFPCQDLSQAGTTAGIDGKKSGLVAEVWRLLATRRVPWVLLENVPFMLRLKKGRALEVVVTALETLGYRWAYRVIDSRAFGLPHRRERVFIVASLDDDPKQVLLVDDAKRAISLPEVGSAYGFYWTEGNRGIGWAVDATPPLKGGSNVGIPSPPAIYIPPGKFITPDIRDAERLQGFPKNWTLPATCVTHGRHRWRLVGNAVTVRVAEWLGRRLRRPGKYNGAKDRQKLPDEPWPRAAWGDGKGVRYVSSVSPWPKAYNATKLSSFLKHEGAPLSHGAARGFLTRARAAEKRGDLHFAPGFLDALERHVQKMSPQLRSTA